MLMQLKLISTVLAIKHGSNWIWIMINSSLSFE